MEGKGKLSYLLVEFEEATQEWVAGLPDSVKNAGAIDEFSTFY